MKMKWYFVIIGECVNTADEMEAQDIYEAKEECLRKYLADSWMVDLPAIVLADPNKGWVTRFDDYSWPDPFKYSYIQLHRGMWKGDDWVEDAFWYDDDPDQEWE